MSFRFSIVDTPPPAEKEGNEYVRFTGTSEPYNRGSERQSMKIGVDGAGNPVNVFVTGLDESKVELYRWFTKEEQEQITKHIKEFKPKIAQAYGGEAVIREDNVYFWGRENKAVNKFYSEPSLKDTFFDTARPSHALLFLSICAGAFMDTVAPNKEWAERHQIPHYIKLETDDVSFEGEEDITRSDAHGILSQFRRENPEALLILAWCLLSETTTFGGMNRATPQKDLLTSFVHYIDGKLVTKKKKNCARAFIKYAEKWKAPLTRQTLYAEAYLKSGEYFALVNQREKKYVTASGTILGNTIAEAVDNLLKPKFQVDFETLRDAVETKWAE